MGKSTSGAVWLNAERLLPYDFWQFWRNSEDADVVASCAYSPNCRYTRLQGLRHSRVSEMNEAKKVLADEVTALLPRPRGSRAVRETARRTFEEGQAAGGLRRSRSDAIRLRKGYSSPTSWSPPD